ncbi:MAG: uroporphyrinogen-III synthase [Gemmatimonadetes bacterium]|nr:uroporphyrinogen-III synthase [Gemmatimonadota bacterium]
MTGRLDGRVVATTRDGDPADPLVRSLVADGARVLIWPTLVVEPPRDPAPLEEAARSLATYGWIAFTSARAVSALAHRCGPPGELPRVAAVGKATASALEARGWRVDVVAGGEGANALAEAMAAAAELGGTRVLFPASSLARPVLEESLRAHGADVHRVDAYHVRAAPPDPAQVRADLASGVDVVTFASPSAVRSLAEALGDLAGGLAGTGVAAIGGTTARALAELGVPDVEVGPKSGVEGLVDACVQLTNKEPETA